MYDNDIVEKAFFIGKGFFNITELLYYKMGFRNLLVFISEAFFYKISNKVFFPYFFHSLI